jgi:hypothetical protein
LLNPAHPDNGGKAEFFLALGFTREHWRALADAFGEIARRATVTQQIDSPHGSKFIIDDYIDALGSRAAVPTKAKNIMKEHERVVLTTAVPEARLEAGDVGTIVHIHKDGAAYEVEFVALDGHTAAVATLEKSKVRPVKPYEITHARDLAAT